MNSLSEIQYRAFLQNPHYFDSILTEISAACRTELNAEPNKSNWYSILATYGVHDIILKKWEYLTYLFSQSPDFHAKMKEAEELYGV
jgi:hypothetical protein